jgi:glycine betaine/choline ABC-type transport system substrate-binding protein
MSGRLGALLLLAGTLAMSACASPKPVRIGAKAFTEQRILAHALRTLIERELEVPAHVVECEDTFACHRLLRGGSLDVMVEYTGTAALYSGRSFVVEEPIGAPPLADGGVATDGGARHLAPVRAVSRAEAVDIDALRAAYAPDGIEWIAPLGFDNGYRVVVAARVARERQLRTIADLARAGELVFTVPPSYVQRPGDGLGALLRRHGLRLSGRPMLKADSFHRAELLERGQADVAVLYATDPALGTQSLTALEDRDRFFPRYDAALLATSAALTRHPRLKALLEALKGSVDTASMRRLNAEVDLEGWQPRDAGLRLANRLRPAPAQAANRASPVVIAVPEDGELQAHQARASRAVREVFGGRPVRLVHVAAPLAALTQGRARLALVGAEQLFRRTRRGRLVRERDVEANAVVGVRALHRLGEANERVEAHAGALTTASALGLDDRLVVEREQVLRDGGLLMAAVGDPQLADAVREHGLSSVPPRGNLQQAPWLRPLRIPAGSYPGQSAPIDTVGSQVVLVGPARRSGAAGGGPVAAVRGRAMPLTIGEVRALSRATGMLEAPDPALPGPWSAADGARRRGDEVTILDRVLTALALAYLVWLLKLLYERREDEAAKT